MKKLLLALLIVSITPVQRFASPAEDFSLEKNTRDQIPPEQARNLVIAYSPSNYVSRQDGSLYPKATELFLEINGQELSLVVKNMEDHFQFSEKDKKLFETLFFQNWLAMRLSKNGFNESSMLQYREFQKALLHFCRSYYAGTTEPSQVVESLKVILPKVFNKGIEILGTFNQAQILRLNEVLLKLPSILNRDLLWHAAIVNSGLELTPVQKTGKLLSSITGLTAGLAGAAYFVANLNVKGMNPVIGISIIIFGTMAIAGSSFFAGAEVVPPNSVVLMPKKYRLKALRSFFTSHCKSMLEGLAL